MSIPWCWIPKACVFFYPPGWCLMSTRFLKCAYGWTFFSYFQWWFGVMNACAGSKEREFQKFCRFSNFFWLIQTHHSTHPPKVPGLKGFFWWYIVEQPPVISHSKLSAAEATKCGPTGAWSLWKSQFAFSSTMVWKIWIEGVNVRP